MSRCRVALRGIWPVVLVMCCASSWAATGNDLVTMKLIADVSQIKPGEPFHIGLLLTIEPGWHVYWKNPGDSGAPTTATLNLPKGFTAGDWQYPVPRKISDPAGTIFGYSDEVMLIATITPDASLPTRKQNLFSCDGQWLVCQKVCLIGSGTATLSLPSGAEAIDDNRELFTKWKARIPSPANRAKVSVDASGQGTAHTWSGTIDVPLPAGAHDVEWFPGPSNVVSITEIHVAQQQAQAVVSFTAERIGDLKASAGTVESVLGYTLADGSRAGMQIPVSLEQHGPVE